jgi:hypothetical protein
MCYLGSTILLGIMNALAFFMNLCARMEQHHPHIRKATLLSAPSMEYKGRAFAMMHDDRIVLKINGQQLPNLGFLGWQYYKPYGRPVYLQNWVEVPYYFHQDWPTLAQKALDDLKDALGEDL